MIYRYNLDSCTCDRQGDGKCSFIIHFSCAETENTPRHIQHHPFHPQHDLSLSSSPHHLSSSSSESDHHMICNACGDDLKTGFFYECSTPHCSFALDLKCAFLNLTDKSNNIVELGRADQGGNLHLPPHPHLFFSCKRDESRPYLSEKFFYSYCCAFCKLPIIDNTILVYLECNALLHKSCAQIPRNFEKHPIHPSHPLFLIPQASYPDPSFRCNQCGRRRSDGFAYYCRECDIFFDVHCAYLKPKRKTGNEYGFPQFSLNSFYMGHLCDSNLLTFPCQCLICKQIITFSDFNNGLCYTCVHQGKIDDGNCSFIIHKSCFATPLPHIQHHPFLPSHPLILLPLVPSFKCNLCRQQKQDRFAYHCSECNIFFDIRCASLKPKRNNGDFQQLGHFHPLIVCEDDEKNTFPRTCYSCGVCGHPFCDGDKIYFCHECECLLDQYCADHLGPDIKHVLHPEHKLTFWFRPLLHGHRKCRACLSSIGDSGYQCFKCEFYLDIKCSRSDYTVLTSPLHRKPLVLHGAADCKQRCYVCNKQCDTSFYRSLARDFAVHVHCMKMFPTEIKSTHQHPLTLREVKLEELNSMHFVCGACQRTEPTNPLYSCYECPYIAHPQCVFSEKTSFKDFSNYSNTAETKEVDSVLHAFEKMANYNWLDYPSQRCRSRPWEYWDANSKVIEIQTGIWILEEFEPLLNALFRDYGNFCSGSNLSPYPQMLFVTTVCEVLHNMSITNVTDVTKDMLLTWFKGFALGKHAGLDMAFAFDRLFRVAIAQFGLHFSLFIDPNFARVWNTKIAERSAIVLDAEESDEECTICLGKFKLLDEIKDLGKERVELEKTQLKGKRSMYEWKKEWLTDTLELMGEKTFVIQK